MMVTRKKNRSAVTSAFRRFYDDTLQLVNFLIFIHNLADRADTTAKIASKALLPLETDKEKIRRLRHMSRKGSGAIKRFDEFRKLLRELFSVRLVDSYLCYIADLLTVLHSNKIELLSSKSQITYEEILSFENVKELHSYLIEKRVIDLSYKGIDELNNEVVKRLGFSFFSTRNEQRKITFFVEVRNLLVHNRGKIDRRFIHKTNYKKQKLGEEINLGDPFGNLMFVLLHSYNLDGRARKKFKISQKRFIPTMAIRTWKHEIKMTSKSKHE